MTRDSNDRMWGTRSRVRARKSVQCISNLEKHRSLPELRIPSEDRLEFRCGQCGLTNTLFPLCLWCTWPSQQSEHAFAVYIPRVRHVSSPSRAFQLEPPSKDISAHDSIPASFSTSATAHPRTPPISWYPPTRRKSRGLFLDPPSFVAHSIPEVMDAAATMCDLDVKSHDDSQMGAGEGRITGQRVDEENVATATPLTHSRSASVCEGHRVPRDPLPHEEKTLSSVDRSLTSSHPSNLPPLLIIDTNDMKTDEDQLTNLVPFNDDGTKTATLSPRQQELRSLRRRKHLNVLQTSPTTLAAREPIPITLKLRSPASKPSLKLQHVSPTQDVTYTPHDRPRALSQQISIQTDSSDSPVTPQTPTPLPMPPSTSPTGLSTSDASSSPVRLGHPSRPYYTAIRKQGISPTSLTSSQPSPFTSPSLSTNAAPRRRSYTPSSSTPVAIPAMSTAASRHLSMSTMFCSPAYSHPPETGFSALSLQDDGDDAQGGGDNLGLPIMPPSPPPNTARFSFPRRSKEVRRSLVDGIQSLSGSSSPTTHAQTLSVSYSRRSGYRGSGVGFSMSGQTELRMALAVGAAASGNDEDGFRFKETAPAVDAVEATGDTRLMRGLQEENVRHAKGASGSFMGRVRRLRKGLKDILLMNSNTTTTTHN
ncbi:hypothetical protein BDN70DRAFT_879449, partial [Pholiota conissans]